MATKLEPVRALRSYALRLRELIGMLERAGGPDPRIDTQISMLLQRELHGTYHMDEAMKIVRRATYQWGMRWHENGEWSAYVEQRSAVSPFAWGSHVSAPIALCIAALISRANELSWPVEE